MLTIFFLSEQVKNLISVYRIWIYLIFYFYRVNIKLKPVNFISKNGIVCQKSSYKCVILTQFIKIKCQYRFSHKNTKIRRSKNFYFRRFLYIDNL
ncbi:hypothetical protein DYQ05_06935 [Treponema pedis]|nr:hypothetical protein DYQ05_06935 [Treponema pedis]